MDDKDKSTWDKKVVMERRSIVAVGLLLIFLGLYLVQQQNIVGWGVACLGAYLLFKED